MNNRKNHVFLSWTIPLHCTLYAYVIVPTYMPASFCPRFRMDSETDFQTNPLQMPFLFFLKKDSMEKRWDSSLVSTNVIQSWVEIHVLWNLGPLVCPKLSTKTIETEEKRRIYRIWSSSNYYLVADMRSLLLFPWHLPSKNWVQFSHVGRAACTSTSTSTVQLQSIVRQT